MPDVTAEFVQIGAVRMAEPCALRRHRRSHLARHPVLPRLAEELPRSAAPTIINNPFWWSADDKFFNYALATKLGVAIPPTVLLPHKEHPPGTTERSMRNLQYPLDWDVDLRVRRLPRVPQAVRRRRLARRLQGQHAARSSSPPTTRRARCA